MANASLFSAGASTFEPSSGGGGGQQPGNTRFVPKRPIFTGLGITLGANESIEFEFSSNHTDNFLDLFSGTNGDGESKVQLSSGAKTGVAVRILPSGGSTQSYSVGAIYSHGAVNTLTLTAGENPTDITLTLNGSSAGLRNIGTNSLYLDGCNSGIEFLWRVEYKNSSGDTVKRYDFTESSGTTTAPAVGTGNLVHSSEPKRFEFSLDNGVWVANLPPPYATGEKIKVPVDAAKYRNAPLPSNLALNVRHGHGQSLGAWFLNTNLNEQRNYGTVENAYNYSSSGPAGLHKYSPRKDVQAAGHPLLSSLVGTGDYTYANDASPSTAIADLDKGSNSYQTYVDDMANILSSLRTGDSIVSASMTFTQGERDGSIGTSYADYKALLLGLYADYKADMRTASGNNSLPVKFYYNQVGLSNSNQRDVMQAQYDAFKENTDNDFVFVTPQHSLNRNYNDELDADFVHLSPLGYTILEEFYARATVDNSWQPILTENAVSDIANNSQTVTVSCIVQTSPLRAKVTATDHLGIVYITPSGSEITPSSVTLSGSVITIDVGQAVQTGGKIRFGSGILSGGELVNIVDSTEWVGVDSGITHSHQLAAHDIDIAQTGTVNSRPIATITGPTTANSAQQLTFTASATDADDDTVTFTWSASNGVVLSATTGSTVTATMPTVGTGTQQSTITAVPNDGTEDGDAVVQTVTVSAVVQPQTQFVDSLSDRDEMDQYCDYKFASAASQNGVAIPASQFVSAEYSISDMSYNRLVMYTLNNGISISDDVFVISVDGDDLTSSGGHWHQLKVTDTNGCTSIVFNRLLFVRPTIGA